MIGIGNGLLGRTIEKGYLKGLYRDYYSWVVEPSEITTTHRRIESDSILGLCSSNPLTLGSAVGGLQDLGLMES